MIWLESSRNCSESALVMATRIKFFNNSTCRKAIAIHH
ncbi:hypothetical protein APA_3431 [Pseudanabaena sp. lw0831]|nr:hypothetical protein APA_3431 [Pseudanabaena sp. lw0831]